MIPEYSKHYLITIDSTREQVKALYTTKREFVLHNGEVWQPEDVTVEKEISAELYYLNEK